MEKLLEAIKTNDLIKAQKALTESMKDRVAALIKEEKIALARAVFVEGEEPEDDDEDEAEEDKSDDEEDEE